jgi:hypothetical protein
VKRYNEVAVGITLWKWGRCSIIKVLQNYGEDRNYRAIGLTKTIGLWEDQNLRDYVVMGRVIWG